MPEAPTRTGRRRCRGGGERISPPKSHPGSGIRDDHARMTILNVSAHLFGSGWRLVGFGPIWGEFMPSLPFGIPKT